MKKISKEEFERLHNLMLSLIGREGYNHQSSVWVEVYNLHTIVFYLHDKSALTCQPCIAGLYKKIKNYYLDFKGEYGYQ